MAKTKSREEVIKVRLSKSEKAAVGAYVLKLTPPQSVSSWLRGFIWKEVGL